MTTTTRADIENFNDYIKSKKFAHPYITGVLSFEENDTDENLKQKMIADFEEVLFLVFHLKTALLSCGFSIWTREG
jgi:hypothetical protein